ncbi:cation transporter [Rhodanobacter glycinis]|uniref:Cation transporter n=1 Tax=Rhodanobacter glycinis TaxID=582702 RepID=A0A502C6M9_9GAMM|nr:cation transporter [Rhodanobacter glycinis]TPG08568.1 cation transporter [Rhodanobacter glycinis]
MANCDECCGAAATQLATRQRGVLKTVLVINAIAFMIMVVAAVQAHSSALLSDSFDYLGDALTYLISLWAVGRSGLAKAQVARIKGRLIVTTGLLVLVQLGWRMWHPVEPLFAWMGAFSLLGLLTNGLCLMLLYQHRDDDLNMASVWICSRNDIIANLSVLLAAAGVWMSNAMWPDQLVALGLALLLLRSGLAVLSRGSKAVQAG